MATLVFVDTGAHYALADVQDPDHAEAVRLLQQIVRLRYALVTSNFVISEVYTLLRQRLGWEAAIHYVEELRVGSTQVIRKSCTSVLPWERRAPARLQKPRWSVAFPGKTFQGVLWSRWTAAWQSIDTPTT